MSDLATSILDFWTLGLSRSIYLLYLLCVLLSTHVRVGKVSGWFMRELFFGAIARGDMYVR